MDMILYKQAEEDATRQKQEAAARIAALFEEDTLRRKEDILRCEKRAGA